MKSTLVGLNYIWRHIRRYWVSLIFIFVFICFATYFQMLGPKLMGTSFDDIINYVTISNVDEQSSEMSENINNLVPLTEEQKTQFADASELTGDARESWMNATPEEVKNFYNVQVDAMNVVLSSESTKDGNGLTEDQVNDLMDLKVETVKSLALANGAPQVAVDQINTTNVDEYAVFDNTLNASDEDLATMYEEFDRINVTEDEISVAYDEFQRGILMFVVSIFLTMFGMVIYQILMVFVSSKSQREMRKGLFSKIAELSISFFDRSNDGDLLSRFTNDIDNISNAMNQTLIMIVSQIVMLCAIIYMMFSDDSSSFVIAGHTVNNILTWTLIVFAIFAVVCAVFVIRQAAKYVSLQQEKLGNLNGFVDERISGQKVIITYGLEDETMEQFEEYNDELLQNSIKGQVYSGLLFPLMTGVGLVNLGFLVCFGSYFVMEGVMTAGLLLTFITYSQRFFGPLAQLVSQYNMVELAFSGANRVQYVLDQEPELVDMPNAITIDKTIESIEIENVSFSYNKVDPILNNIDISVKKGQMVALVGPTGSGKTTVMNLMNRFYDVDNGAIKFDGTDIREFTLNSLRKNVGIVLQESLMFTGTIFENIAYGKENATKEEVIHAAKTANIHDYILTLDEGYETLVNNSTTLFSTGQKQLISIARTILTDPNILILDEATSNVDTVTEASIQKAMENVLKGRTSFVIAHRLKTILNADEIVVLQDGNVIEKGSHHALLEEDGFYAELYHNQFVKEK